MTTYPHLAAWMFAAVTALATGSVSAQNAQPEQTDHAQHQPSAQPPAETPPPTSVDHQDHAATASESVVDHGSSRNQGGPAPSDARDPHGYSDGFVLGSGPYAIGTQRTLHLGDEHRYTSFLVDRLERTHSSSSNETSYEAQAWFGNPYNKLVVKAEGEVSKGKVQDARNEVLWGRAIAGYWDTQLGVRHDSGEGPNRTWLAFGVQGLAPYWFEVDATAYIGSEGRTALRVSADYDLLITQRLVLQPRIEASFYGKEDRERGIGSGLSSATPGLRLRYDFSRQFAPYIGVERSNTFGNTADLRREVGESKGETRVVAGFRFWF